MIQLLLLHRKQSLRLSSAAAAAAVVQPPCTFLRRRQSHSCMGLFVGVFFLVYIGSRIVLSLCCMSAVAAQHAFA